MILDSYRDMLPSNGKHFLFFLIGLLFNIFNIYLSLKLDYLLLTFFLVYNLLFYSFNNSRKLKMLFFLSIFSLTFLFLSSIEVILNDSFTLNKIDLQLRLVLLLINSFIINQLYFILNRFFYLSYLINVNNFLSRSLLYFISFFDVLNIKKITIKKIILKIYRIYLINPSSIEIGKHELKLSFYIYSISFILLFFILMITQIYFF